MPARKVGLALLSACVVAMTATGWAQQPTEAPVYGIYTPPGATPPVYAPPANTAPAHPPPAYVPPARAHAPPANPQKSESPAAQSACRGDYVRLCQGVQPGGGRVIACLSDHQKEVSPGCLAALMSLRAAR